MNDNNTTSGAQLGSVTTMPAENNKYLLRDFNEGNPSQEVIFYKMNPDGSHENGTTLEEMLRVSIERLSDLNRRFYCEENKIALQKMNEALMWLNKRTQNRIARGVEGKHIA